MSDPPTQPEHPLFERVKRIIEEHLGVEPERITPSAMFTDDFGADSLDRIELVMALEEAFGVEISDAAADRISTVSDALDLLEKLGAKPSPSPDPALARDLDKWTKGEPTGEGG
jgi:acyl carrier protein